MASILSGPSTPPAGAVRVDPGQNLNSMTQAYPGGTTFWLATGTHTLGTSEFGQVLAKEGNTYIGAPGAVLDGKRVNRYAFSQGARAVTIKHLKVTGFVPPSNEAVINASAASDWKITNNTIEDNSGSGVFTGDNVLIRDNCITNNGAHGIGGYKPTPAPGFGPSAINNVTVSNNEISYHPRDKNLETNPDGSPTYCGCSGGAKFWDTKGAKVTNNWAHHNTSPALWADTNNVDFLLAGNYLSDNGGEAIWYEISYNAKIINNTFMRNAITKGQGRSDWFPDAAIYISEAGGDSRVSSVITGTKNLDISHNYFEDNWNGVAIYEGANRFCNSSANTSSGYCTKVNPEVTHGTCSDPATGGKINVEPYYSDCRWKSQNIKVHDNVFRFDPSHLGNCDPAKCGRNALFSDYGGATGTPSWWPYQGNVTKDSVTFKQNNVFSNNQYFGPWRFTPYDTDRNIDFAGWQAAPYNQDAGSTSPAAPRPANALDVDTQGLEGSAGKWIPWYSTSIARSTAQAKAGDASLQVSLTGNSGWGVAVNNWPGFPTTAGPKTVSFWARLGSGSVGVTANVKWRDAAGADLQVDTVTVSSLTSTWQQGRADVTAPAGARTVAVEFVSTSGAAGSSFYIDEVFVADR